MLIGQEFAGAENSVRALNMASHPEGRCKARTKQKAAAERCSLVRAHHTHAVLYRATRLREKNFPPTGEQTPFSPRLAQTVLCCVRRRTTAAKSSRAEGHMDDMPNAGEIIERLARENERQKIEIEQLKRRIAELERQLTDKAS